MAPGECGHLQLGVGLLQGYFHQTAGASLNADDQTLVASAQAARLNLIESRRTPCLLFLCESTVSTYPLVCLKWCRRIDYGLAQEPPQRIPERKKQK